MERLSPKVHKRGWLQKGSRVEKLKRIFESAMEYGRKMTLSDIAMEIFGSSDERAKGMSIPVIGGLKRHYENQPMSTKRLLLSVWNKRLRCREYFLANDSTSIAMQIIPVEKKTSVGWDKMNELNDYLAKYFPNDGVARYEVQKVVLTFAQQLIADTLKNLNPNNILNYSHDDTKHQMLGN